MDSAATALIHMIGVATMHRPYEPATPLGTSAGIDFSVELTLVRISDATAAVLAENGLAAATSLGVIPVPKFHLHKGISDRMDVGFSGVYYQSYMMWGLDAKLVVFQPEEGPTWAIRFAYSTSDFGLVSAKNMMPQIVVSKAMTFADPYIGMGYEYSWGSVHFEHPVTVIEGLPPGTIIYDHSGVGGTSFVGFVGLGLRLAQKGLRLTVEGSYNSEGMNTLGTKIGFVF